MKFVEQYKCVDTEAFSRIGLVRHKRLENLRWDDLSPLA